MTTETLKREQQTLEQSALEQSVNLPSAMDVARYFLHKSQSDSRPNTKITHLKLQKLVYYAQAWHLAMLNRPLFDSRLEAWVHGPVSPELYNLYRPYGYQVIPHIVASSFAFTKPMLEVLKAVWHIYGDKDAKELEKLTHSETPWLKARGNTPLDMAANTEISRDDMRDYYAEYLNKG
ncbi:Panacea domain-containing protein [Priestia sp. D51]